MTTAARVPAGGTLAPAGISLTQQELAGQWHAADGTLTGESAGPARWSGTGTWQPPAPGNAPRVSLTVGWDDGTGYTVGRPASAAMLVQVGETVINADDGDESDYYLFSKAPPIH